MRKTAVIACLLLIPLALADHCYVDGDDGYCYICTTDDFDAAKYTYPVTTRQVEWVECSGPCQPGFDGCRESTSEARDVSNRETLWGCVKLGPGGRAEDVGYCSFFKGSYECPEGTEWVDCGSVCETGSIRSASGRKVKCGSDDDVFGCIISKGSGMYAVDKCISGDDYRDRHRTKSECHSPEAVARYCGDITFAVSIEDIEMKDCSATKPQLGGQALGSDCAADGIWYGQIEESSIKRGRVWGCVDESAGYLDVRLCRSNMESPAFYASEDGVEGGEDDECTGEWVDCGSECDTKGNVCGGKTDVFACISGEDASKSGGKDTRVVERCTTDPSARCPKDSVITHCGDEPKSCSTFRFANKCNVAGLMGKLAFETLFTMNSGGSDSGVAKSEPYEMSGEYGCVDYKEGVLHVSECRSREPKPEKGEFSISCRDRGDRWVFCSNSYCKPALARQTSSSELTFDRCGDMGDVPNCWNGGKNSAHCVFSEQHNNGECELECGETNDEKSFCHDRACVEKTEGGPDPKEKCNEAHTDYYRENGICEDWDESDNECIYDGPFSDDETSCDCDAECLGGICLGGLCTSCEQLGEGVSEGVTDRGIIDIWESKCKSRGSAPDNAALFGPFAPIYYMFMGFNQFA